MLALAALTLIIWTYLFFFHGDFWRLRFASATPSKSRPLVACVIPARNEADVIGRTVSSLLRQEFAGELRVFLVDDGSSDGTAQAAHQAGGARVTVIQGASLPLGWSGKVWAMHQGANAALAVTPDYLLFTDADIDHAPGSVARLTAIAAEGKYDLVSQMVKLHCGTFAEKLLIPAFVYFFFLLYPPKCIADRRRSTAGAAGGCMLVRPEALQRAGGLERIAGEIIDDCALARQIKRAGGKLWLELSATTRSTRAYETLGEIHNMIARTAFNQLRHSALLLIGCIAGLALTFVAPIALLFVGTPAIKLISGAACLLMLLTYVPMVRFYGLNVFLALTLPFSAVFYLAATISSALRYWRGRGGQWKGRAQDVAAQTTSSGR